MLARTLAVLALSLFLPALLRADDAPKGDEDLDGDWQIVKEVSGGKEQPYSEVAPVFTFEKGTLTIKVGDEGRKATVKVDAAKSPQTLDEVIEDGGDLKGKTVKAIYEIKGDELRVCHGAPGADRPTELSSKDGDGLVIVILKRVKK
jgi:uncharacterized protein (TIGR03067 family)